MINRSLWLKERFFAHEFPAWQCPHCHQGNLTLDRGSIDSEETPASKAAHQLDEWEPEWIEETFTMRFRCGNHACGGTVLAVGKSHHESYWDEHDVEVWGSRHEPMNFIPFLEPIAVPEKCPWSVRQHIDQAFGLFWASPAAAGNSLRVAVEALLTELGIARFGLFQVRNRVRRERRPLNLARRIGMLRPGRADLATKLDAIRWIGNPASHGGEIKRADILDSCEIIVAVLAEVYPDDDNDHVGRVVSQIVKRKKPRSTLRRRP